MDQNRKNKIQYIIIIILSISAILLNLDRIRLYQNIKEMELNNNFYDRTIDECYVEVTNMLYACGDFCPRLFRIDKVIHCEGDSLFFINKEMTVIFLKDQSKSTVESSLTRKFIFKGRIQSNNLGLLRMFVNDVVLIDYE